MDAKVFQLINDLIEQRLDPSQVAELTELLRNNPDIEETYLHLLAVHQGLIESEAPVRSFSLEELRTITEVESRFRSDPAPTASELLEPGHLTEAPAPAGPKPHKPRLHLLGYLMAIAASVLLALGAVSLWDQGDKQESAKLAPVEPVEPSTATVVAHIIKKVDCSWQEDRWSVSSSAQIIEGQQISLSEGLLVLEFENGAVITLDGPSKLVATSGNGAKLLEGKLSARVPPRGRGFKIETHYGDFVDLGTEFGLIVADDGTVETHVFKGKVVAEPSQASAADPSTIVLETGAAWVHSKSTTRGRKAEAVPQQFILPDFPDDDQPLDPPPVARNLAMWFQAGNRVQQDDKGNVAAWGDNSDLCDPKNTEQKAEDAWQVSPSKRPQWVAKAIGGQPALRFDGFKGLITEPVRLGSNQTTAVVFRVDGVAARRLIRGRKEYKHLGVQLMNLNGPPHAVMQVNEDLRVEARIHMGFLRDQSEPIDWGYTCSQSPVSNEEGHIAVYSYDSDNSIARLYVDGVLTCESVNVSEIAPTSSPRFLGSHFEREGFGFTGDISDILVFDTALSPGESAAISTWLADKYGLTPQIAKK